MTNYLVPAVLANHEYIIKAERDEALDGFVVWFRFPNNYGISVIRNKYSYGNKHGEGLFEAAFIRFKDDSDNWDFVKDSDFAGFDYSGVQGWLTLSDLDRLIIMILNIGINAIGR